VVERRKLDALRRVEEKVKDLRIEIASYAITIANKSGDYAKMYRDTRKGYCNSDRTFRVVATGTSDYDGQDVTVPVSAHKTYSAALKSLKAAAQDLSFDERAKAFDRMKVERDEGARVQEALKVEAEKIRLEEEAERAEIIETDAKREYKKKPGKRQHQLRQKRHYKLH
jgi:hypothetical protein